MVFARWDIPMQWRLHMNASVLQWFTVHSKLPVLQFWLIWKPDGFFLAIFCIFFIEDLLCKFPCNLKAREMMLLLMLIILPLLFSLFSSSLSLSRPSLFCFFWKYRVQDHRSLPGLGLPLSTCRRIGWVYLVGLLSRTTSGSYPFSFTHNSQFSAHFPFLNSGHHQFTPHSLRDVYHS